MGSNHAGFFQDVNILFRKLRVGMFGVVVVNELGEAQSAGHTGGASSDNDDIGFHCRAFDALKRFTKNDH
jgi:hypothetical protein